MTPIPACVALSYPSVFVRANPQESVYEFLGRGSTARGYQNLRSHSEPLQGRQGGVGFFKDEVALELTPCHSPLKTFTLYN
jgi:hypothetical protein